MSVPSIRKYLSDTPQPLPGVVGEKKPSKKEIFDQLAERTCRVCWQLKDITLHTTGCFIKPLGSEKIQILTCFHDESWGNAKVSMFFKTWNSGLVNYTANCCIDKRINLKTAKQMDLCLLDISVDKHPPFHHFFEQSQTTNFLLDLGEKVYFSGFPLSQESPLIHVGRVSSKNFSIDGTVVEGHSGGPVVISDNGRLELIGVISSQIVAMTATLLKASRADIPPVSVYNDFPGSYGDSNIRLVLKDLIDNFFRNISTGIGKANALTDLPTLFKKEDTSTQEQIPSSLVTSLPTAEVKKTDETVPRILIGKYAYVYGAGNTPNRAIEFYGDGQRKIWGEVHRKVEDSWEKIGEVDEARMIKEGASTKEKMAIMVAARETFTSPSYPLDQPFNQVSYQEKTQIIQSLQPVGKHRIQINNDIGTNPYFETIKSLTFFNPF